MFDNWMGDPMNSGGNAVTASEASGSGWSERGGSLGGAAPPAFRAVDGWRAALAKLSVDRVDAERVDLIAALEGLKSAAAAAQARLAAAMADEHVERAGGERAKAQAMRSLAGQVGLARRVSPARGMTLVGLSRMLCHDLQGTLTALADGEISEWQAVLVGREAAVLAPAARAELDAALAPLLGPLGDRGVVQEARRLADLVDPETVARRVRRAEADRRVTVRPAPGPIGCAMARLTATMPVAQAVAAYARLRQHAESARNSGDPRGIGQLMSDELFAWLTTSSAVDEAGPSVGVEIGLVMSERTLLRGGGDPAVLTDHQGRAFGHVPAFLARRLVRGSDRAWLTRLYAAPATGELVAMDSRRRAFGGRLRRLLVWRDQVCRMPWCEAPIRHADHVRGYASGGDTAAANGAGLCESCNYLKEAPGWRADVIERPGHLIEFSTPSGHVYRSQPPPTPGHHVRSLDEHVERGIDDWDDGSGERAGGAA